MIIWHNKAHQYVLYLYEKLTQWCDRQEEINSVRNLFQVVQCAILPMLKMLMKVKCHTV